jgi:hypothetical protein
MESSHIRIHLHLLSFYTSKPRPIHHYLQLVSNSLDYHSEDPAFRVFSHHRKIIKMCMHKRFVYSCNHFDWGIQVQACELQKAHDAGFLSICCDTMNTHPLHSRKISQMCSRCEVEKAAVTGKVMRVREKLKELNAIMQRIQEKKTSASDEEKESSAGSGCNGEADMEVENRASQA